MEQIKEFYWKSGQNSKDHKFEHFLKDVKSC